MKLDVNGRVRDLDVEPDTPLLWALRENAQLTGTKYGCGVAQCGSCTVHVNGEATRSCSVPVGSLKAGDKVVTIEGLSSGATHAVQRAWAELDPVLPDSQFKLMFRAFSWYVLERHY